MSDLGSSKLNKIARDVLKIYEFAWGQEIQSGTHLIFGNFFQISTYFDLIKRF
jgi:hypothetical protein